MDENRFGPTFSNILSSLRINGASVTGGNGKNGFVPVLGSDGTLDLSVIPITAMYGMVDVPALGDTAFVDHNAVETPGVEQTGSIAKPFKTMKDASAKGFRNFILIGSGEYGSDEVVWPVNSNAPVHVYSLGSSTFTYLKFSNYSAGTRFEISNVSFGQLLFAHQSVCYVSFIGPGSVNTLAATFENGSLSAFVDDGYAVAGTSGDVTVGHLTSSSLMANDSAVAGDTVSDALDKLAIRKIRIPIFGSNESGLYIASSYDVAVGNDDKYSLDGLEYGLGALVAAINGVFHKDGDSVNYADVTATGVVSSPSVSSDNITTNAVTFRRSGATVFVSSDNFLEVSEE